MYLTLETKTDLNGLDEQYYYNIFEVNIVLNRDDFDYEGDLSQGYLGYLPLELLKESDGTEKDEVNIGYMRIFSYNFSSICWEDHDTNYDLIACTDGEDMNLGRPPLYFSPDEVVNDYLKFSTRFPTKVVIDHLKFGTRYSSEMWRIERGKSKKNVGIEPSTFLINNMVTKLWHFDMCEILPKYRGYDFGKDAFKIFRNKIIQPGEAISLIPYSPTPNENMQGKQSRSQEKMNQLLLRYWNGLGLDYYDPKHNILWNLF